MLQAFYQVITAVHSVFRYLQQIKLVTNKFFALSLIIFTPLYLLTPWIRVLLEKLIGFQLVKKFPTFYGNRSFITADTNARHLSLS